MTYRECLDYFHELSVHRNIDGLQDDTYFQFDVIGRDSGHFYIHLKDDTFEVASGEYKQRNVQFIVTVSCLEKVINGVMDPIYAYATGKLNITGDVSLGRNFLSRIIKD